MEDKLRREGVLDTFSRGILRRVFFGDALGRCKLEACVKKCGQVRNSALRRRDGSHGASVSKLSQVQSNGLCFAVSVGVFARLPSPKLIPQKAILLIFARISK